MPRNRKKCRDKKSKNPPKNEAQVVIDESESLDELISKLPIPPLHSSESTGDFEFSDDLTDFSAEFDYERVLVGKIADLQSRNESLENEKLMITKEYEEMISGIRKEHTTVIDEKNLTAKRHVEQLETLKKQLKVEKEEKQRVMDSMKKKHDKAFEEQTKRHSIDMETMRRALDCWEKYESSRAAQPQQAPRNQIVEVIPQHFITEIETRRISYNEMTNLLVQQRGHVINSIEQNSKILKNNVLYCVKEEMERLSLSLSAKPKMWQWIYGGILNLAGRFKAHFMRQPFIWKVVYVLLLQWVLRMLLTQEPKTVIQTVYKTVPCKNCKSSRWTNW